MRIRRISDRTFGILCTIPGLVALLALVVYPIGYNFVLSFMRYNNILPKKFIGFHNYLWFFSFKDFLISWTVSGIYSLGCASVTFLFGLITAHALNQIDKLKPFFRTLIILPWAIPFVVSGIIWRWIFNQNVGVLNFILSSLNIIDTNIPFLINSNFAMISAIIATAYIHIPFVTILIYAGLQTIPQELYEAAQVDGADGFQQFWYITAPLNRAQMILAVLIIWMFTFRAPDVIFSLTKGGPGDATYHAGLFLMDTIYSYMEFGHGAAISIMLFLTVLIIVPPVLYFGIIRSSDIKQ